MVDNGMWGVDCVVSDIDKHTGGPLSAMAPLGMKMGFATSRPVKETTTGVKAGPKESSGDAQQVKTIQRKKLS